MDPAEQIKPALLLLAGITLFLLGTLIWRRIRECLRFVSLLFCWIPAIVLLSIALHFENGLREDARKSARIFARLDPGPDLTQEEGAAFEVLTASSPRVREGVMRLA